MSLIDVTDLRVELSDGSATIVDRLSFQLEPGEVMGLVGESGSGKSTVALGLLGYARPGGTITQGSVVIDGSDLLRLPTKQLYRARGTVVSYVPQDPGTALNPSVPIGVQLVEGLGKDARAARGRAKELLERVGLPGDDSFLKRKPYELSGGQQQRVAIAMAIIGGPKLIVLDEPTTGLDVTTQAKVLELVKGLCRSEQMAAVYVSHDLAVVADVADKVTVMYGGAVVEYGSTQQVLHNPAHPYTRALLAAVPSARERMRLIPIDGRAPGLGEITTGCVFAPRCPFAVERCTEVDPLLEPVAEGHRARCIRLDVVLSTPYVVTKESDVREVPEGPAPILSAQGVDAFYGGKQVLFDAGVEVRAGECVAVVGESGSGKTTLSRCLIGLHSEWAGDATLNGDTLPFHASARSAEARRELQYIFQNPYASLNPRRTVGDSMAESRQHFFGATTRSARAEVREALERVELPAALAMRYPAELSGGQRQRVAIARALLCEPRVLICDEVTSALDVSVQASVVELLRSLLNDGLGMVFVTHNLAVVRSIADSVVVLNRGRVVEAGTASSVLDAPADVYTQSLLADTLEIA